MSFRIECPDTRECFASVTYRERRYCKALTDPYEKDGQCPFCKARITDLNDGREDHKCSVELSSEL